MGRWPQDSPGHGPGGRRRYLIFHSTERRRLDTEPCSRLQGTPSVPDQRGLPASGRLPGPAPRPPRSPPPTHGQPPHPRRRSDWRRRPTLRASSTAAGRPRLQPRPLLRQARGGKTASESRPVLAGSPQSRRAPALRRASSLPADPAALGHRHARPGPTSCGDRTCGTPCGRLPWSLSYLPSHACMPRPFAASRGPRLCSLKLVTPGSLQPYPPLPTPVPPPRPQPRGRQAAPWGPCNLQSAFPCPSPQGEPNFHPAVSHQGDHKAPT